MKVYLKSNVGQMVDLCLAALLPGARGLQYPWGREDGRKAYFRDWKYEACAFLLLTSH